MKIRELSGEMDVENAVTWKGKREKKIIRQKEKREEVRRIREVRKWRK